MKKLSDVSQGGMLSANELNRLMNEVERASRVTAEYPLEAQNGPGGTTIRLNDSSFWARLTDYHAEGDGCSTWRYSWEEIQFAKDATVETMPGGRKGKVDADFAYEVNGSCVEIGTVVRISPAANGEWVFENCCGSSASSSSSSTSESTSGSETSTSEASQSGSEQGSGSGSEISGSSSGSESEGSEGSEGGSDMSGSGSDQTSGSKSGSGSSGGSSSSSSDGVSVVTDVTCDHGLAVTNKVLTAHVIIDGVHYPVIFSLS
ncbi:hypothetical protein [Zavarzinella formosa]|uniref:hypothetical protein n=1 Tax=Zavarzinella formosa TaxID=360055 RepID=UPI00138AC605|nr:hypothetical protein [Zavarzinella formosa]